MSGMAGLPARSSLALGALFSSPFPLWTRQPVRTRRLGRVSGVPSSFRQFLFQLSDLFLLLGDPFLLLNYPFPSMLQIAL